MDKIQTILIFGMLMCIFVVVTGFFALGESLTLTQGIIAFFICVGMILIVVYVIAWFNKQDIRNKKEIENA